MAVKCSLLGTVAKTGWTSGWPVMAFLMPAGQWGPVHTWGTPKGLRLTVLAHKDMGGSSHHYHKICSCQPVLGFAYFQIYMHWYTSLQETFAVASHPTAAQDLGCGRYPHPPQSQDPQEKTWIATYSLTGSQCKEHSLAAEGDPSFLLPCSEGSHSHQEQHSVHSFPGMMVPESP